MSTPRLLLLALLLAGCAGAPESPPRLTIVQINDVYEITPVEGGRRGGLARVATIRDRLRAENPDTVLLLAGDFYSPSALGTAKVDGERLAGRQMVAVLNALGVDYATFGNHEFDVDETQFLARLSESRFRYVSSNVFDREGRPFPGVVPHAIVEIGDAGDPAARIGILGVTIDSNRQDYVRYEDFVAAARREVGALAGRVDAIVALTHLSIEEDARLVTEVPEIDLVIGGHEHENRHLWRGPDSTPIAKADANARSVNVIDLEIDPESRAIRVELRFVPVTDAVPDEPSVAAEAARWVETAYAGFRAGGFEPTRTVATLAIPLDGLEASVRNRSTALTELIGRAMLAEVPEAEIAVYNSGAIRIDDVLPPGPVTEYDVIRTLPFGGRVVSAEVRGEFLGRVLTQGQANRGTGGYLQVVWRGPPSGPEPDRWYRVAISDFLLTGRETNLGWLTRDHPDVRSVAEARDVRMAVIDELARGGG